MGFPAKIAMIGKSASASLILVVMLTQALQTGHLHAASADPSALRHQRGFGISGVVARLFPGRHAVLVLRVRNYQRFPITLRWVGVKVRRPSRRCAASNLQIHPFNGHRRIAARRWVRLRLRVFMKRTAPNACQGIRFPLTYRGKAVRA